MQSDSFFADLEITSREGAPDTYSVKLDGIEISNYIKWLSLEIKAGGFAELTLKANVEKISVNSRCIWQIPEPYRFYCKKIETCPMDDKKTPADVEDRRARKKAQRKYAMREFWREYGGTILASLVASVVCNLLIQLLKMTPG